MVSILLFFSSFLVDKLKENVRDNCLSRDFWRIVLDFLCSSAEVKGSNCYGITTFSLDKNLNIFG